jgi:uncharacterized protein
MHGAAQRAFLMSACRKDWTRLVIGFNISQLLKAPTGTTRHVEVDELSDALKTDLGLVSPTRGSLRLTRTASGILVSGTLTHQVETTCSRCLEPYVRTQTIEMDEEFLPVVDVNTGVPLVESESEDPDAFRLTSQHMLDLDEAIRQYAILESPLQPLCREDCRGLCTVCGVNLNLQGCPHQDEAGQGPSGTFGELLAEKIRQAGFKPGEE